MKSQQQTQQRNSHYDVRVSLAVSFNPMTIFVTCLSDNFSHSDAMWLRVVRPKVVALVDAVKQQIGRAALALGMEQGHKIAVDATFNSVKSRQCVVPAGSGVSVVRRAAVSKLRMQKLSDEERVALNAEWGAARIRGGGSSATNTDSSMMKKQENFSSRIAEEIAVAMRDMELVVVDGENAGLAAAAAAAASSAAALANAAAAGGGSNSAAAAASVGDDIAGGRNGAVQHFLAEKEAQARRKQERASRNEVRMARRLKRQEQQDAAAAAEAVTLQWKKQLEAMGISATAFPGGIDGSRSGEAMEASTTNLNDDEQQQQQQKQPNRAAIQLSGDASVMNSSIAQDGNTSSKKITAAGGGVSQATNNAAALSMEEMDDDESEEEIDLPKHHFFQMLRLPPELRFNELAELIVMTEIIDVVCDYDHRDLVAVLERRKPNHAESQHLLWRLKLVHTTTHPPVAGTAGLILPIASRGNVELGTADPQASSYYHDPVTVTMLVFEWTVPAATVELYETKSKKSKTKSAAAASKIGSGGLVVHRSALERAAALTTSTSFVMDSSDDDMEDEERELMEEAVFERERSKMMGMLMGDDSGSAQQRPQHQQQSVVGTTASKSGGSDSATPTTTSKHIDAPSAASAVVVEGGGGGTGSPTKRKQRHSLANIWFSPRHTRWSISQCRWRRKKMLRLPSSFFENLIDKNERVAALVSRAGGEWRRVPPAVFDAACLLSDIEMGVVRADALDDRRRSPIHWTLEHAASLPHDLLLELVMTLLDLGSPCFLCTAVLPARNTIVDMVRCDPAARAIMYECQSRAAAAASRSLAVSRRVSMQQPESSDASAAATGSAKKAGASGDMAALRDAVLDIPPGRCRFATFSATKEYVVYTVSPEGSLLLWDLKMRTCTEVIKTGPGARVLVIPLFPLTRKGQSLRQRLTAVHPNTECDVLLVSSGELLTVDFASTSGPRVEHVATTQVRPDLFEGDGQGWCCTFAWNMHYLEGVGGGNGAGARRGGGYLSSGVGLKIDRATRVAKHLRELGARTDILRSDDELRLRNAAAAAASLSQVVHGMSWKKNRRNNNNSNNNPQLESGPSSSSPRGRAGIDDDENDDDGDEHNHGGLVGSSASGMDALAIFGGTVGAHRTAPGRGQGVGKKPRSFVDDDERAEHEKLEGTVNWVATAEAAKMTSRESHVEFGRRVLMYPYGASKALAETYDEVLQSSNNNNNMNNSNNGDDANGDHEIDSRDKDTLGENHHYGEDGGETASKVTFDQVESRGLGVAGSDAKSSGVKFASRLAKKHRGGGSGGGGSGVGISRHQEQYSQREQQQQQQNTGDKKKRRALSRETSSFAISSDGGLHSAEPSGLSSGDPMTEDEEELFASMQRLRAEQEATFDTQPIAVLALVCDSRPIVLHLRAGLFAHLDVTAPLSRRAALFAQALDESMRCVEDRRARDERRNSNYNDKNNNKAPAAAAAGDDHISETESVLIEATSVSTQLPQGWTEGHGGGSRRPSSLRRQSSKHSVVSGSSNNNNSSTAPLHPHAFGTACPERFVTGLVFSASSASVADPILFAMADGNLIEYRCQTRVFSTHKSALKLEQLPQDGPAETAVFRIARGHATCCVVAPQHLDPRERAQQVVNKGAVTSCAFLGWCGKDFAVSTSTIRMSEDEIAALQYDEILSPTKKNNNKNDSDNSDGRNNTATSSGSTSTPMSMFEPYVVVPDDAADSERTTGFVFPHLFSEDEFFSHLMLFVRRGELCVLDTRRSSRVVRLLRMEATETELTLRRRLGDVFEDEESTLSSGLKLCTVNNTGSLLLVTCRDFDSAAVFPTHVLKEAISRAIVSGMPSRHRELEIASATAEQQAQQQQQSGAMPRESLLSFWSRFVCPDQASFASKCQHIGFFMRLLEIAINNAAKASAVRDDRHHALLSYEETIAKQELQSSINNSSSNNKLQGSGVKAGSVGIHARDGKGGTIFHSFSSILSVWDTSVFSLEVARRWLEILMQHRVNFWIPCNSVRPVDAFRSSHNVFGLDEVLRRESEMQDQFLSRQATSFTTLHCDRHSICRFEDYVNAHSANQRLQQQHDSSTGGAQMVLGNNGRSFISFDGSLFVLLPDEEDAVHHSAQRQAHMTPAGATLAQLKRESSQAAAAASMTGSGGTAAASPLFMSAVSSPLSMASPHGMSFSSVLESPTSHTKRSSSAPAGGSGGGSFFVDRNNNGSSTSNPRLHFLCNLPNRRNVAFTALRPAHLLAASECDVLLSEDGLVVVVVASPSSSSSSGPSWEVECFHINDVIAELLPDRFDASEGCAVMRCAFRTVEEFDFAQRVEFETRQLAAARKRRQQILDEMAVAAASQQALGTPSRTRLRAVVGRIKPSASTTPGFVATVLAAASAAAAPDVPLEMDRAAADVLSNVTCFFSLASREKNREEACLEIVSRTLVVTVTSSPRNLRSSSNSSSSGASGSGGAKELSRLLQCAIRESIQAGPRLCTAVATNFDPMTTSRESIFLAEHATMKALSLAEQTDLRGDFTRRYGEHLNRVATDGSAKLQRQQQQQQQTSPTAGASENSKSDNGQSSSSQHNQKEQTRRALNTAHVRTLQALRDECVNSVSHFTLHAGVVVGVSLIGRLNSNFEPVVQGCSYAFSIYGPDAEHVANNNNSSSCTNSHRAGQQQQQHYFQHGCAIASVRNNITLVDAGVWPTGPCRGFSQHGLPRGMQDNNRCVAKTCVTSQADVLVAICRGPELLVLKRSPRSVYASSLLLPSLHVDPEPDACYHAESIQCTWGSRKQQQPLQQQQPQQQGMQRAEVRPQSFGDSNTNSMDERQQREAIAAAAAAAADAARAVVTTTTTRAEALFVLRDGILLCYDVPTELLLVVGKVTRPAEEFERLRKCEPVMRSSVNDGFDARLSGGQDERLVWDDTFEAMERREDNVTTLLLSSGAVSAELRAELILSMKQGQQQQQQPQPDEVNAMNRQGTATWHRQLHTARSRAGAAGGGHASNFVEKHFSSHFADFIYRVSATHGYVSRLRLNRDAVANGIECDSPPLLLCHRFVPSNRPKPIPTRLLRSFYKMRSGQNHRTAVNKNKNKSSSSNEVASASGTVVGGVFASYLMELCGPVTRTMLTEQRRAGREDEGDEDDDGDDGGSNDILRIIELEEQVANSVADVRSIVSASRPIRCAVRDGDGQLPFFVLGRWLAEVLHHLERTDPSVAAALLNQHDARLTLSSIRNSPLLLEAVLWCRRLLHLGHSPYLTIATPATDCNRSNNNSSINALAAFRSRSNNNNSNNNKNILAQLLNDVIDKEDAMSRDEVSLLHEPIIILSSSDDGTHASGKSAQHQQHQKQQLNDVHYDDLSATNKRKSRGNNTTVWDSSAVVSQLAWSTSRSGIAYAVTDDGALTMLKFDTDSTTEYGSNSSNSDGVSNSSNSRCGFKKQLLPPLSVPFGESIFVTSMRDFNKLDEMKRSDPPILINTEDDDDANGSTTAAGYGGARARLHHLRRAGDGHHQQQQQQHGGSSNRLAQLTWKLAQVPEDIILVSDGATAIAVRMHDGAGYFHAVAERLAIPEHKKPLFSWRKSPQQGTKQQGGDDVDDSSKRSAGHLHNGALEGVAAQWMETLTCTNNPHAPAATFVFGHEMPDASVVLSLRRIFAPAGITTLFPRHVVPMLSMTDPATNNNSRAMQTATITLRPDGSWDIPSSLQHEHRVSDFAKFRVVIRHMTAPSEHEQQFQQQQRQQRDPYYCRKTILTRWCVSGGCYSAGCYIVEDQEEELQPHVYERRLVCTTRLQFPWRMSSARARSVAFPVEFLMCRDLVLPDTFAAVVLAAGFAYDGLAVGVHRVLPLSVTKKCQSDRDNSSERVARWQLSPRKLSPAQTDFQQLDDDDDDDAEDEDRSGVVVVMDSHCDAVPAVIPTSSASGNNSNNSNTDGSAALCFGSQHPHEPVVVSVTRGGTQLVFFDWQKETLSVVDISHNKAAATTTSPGRVNYGQEVEGEDFVQAEQRALAIASSDCVVRFSSCGNFVSLHWLHLQYVTVFDFAFMFNPSSSSQHHHDHQQQQRKPFILMDRDPRAHPRANARFISQLRACRVSPQRNSHSHSLPPPSSSSSCAADLVVAKSQQLSDCSGSVFVDPVLREVIGAFQVAARLGAIVPSRTRDAEQCSWLHRAAAQLCYVVSSCQAVAAAPVQESDGGDQRSNYLRQLEQAVRDVLVAIESGCGFFCFNLDDVRPFDYLFRAHTEVAALFKQQQQEGRQPLFAQQAMSAMAPLSKTLATWWSQWSPTTSGRSQSLPTGNGHRLPPTPPRFRLRFDAVSSRCEEASTVVLVVYDLRLALAVRVVESSSLPELFAVPLVSADDDTTTENEPDCTHTRRESLSISNVRLRLRSSSTPSSLSSSSSLATTGAVDAINAAASRRKILQARARARIGDSDGIKGTPEAAAAAESENSKMTSSNNNNYPAPRCCILRCGIASNFVLIFVSHHLYEGFCLVDLTPNLQQQRELDSWKKNDSGSGDPIHKSGIIGTKTRAAAAAAATASAAMWSDNLKEGSASATSGSAASGVCSSCSFSSPLSSPSDFSASTSSDVLALTMHFVSKNDFIGDRVSCSVLRVPGLFAFSGAAEAESVVTILSSQYCSSSSSRASNSASLLRHATLLSKQVLVMKESLTSSFVDACFAAQITATMYNKSTSLSSSLPVQNSAAHIAVCNDSGNVAVSFKDGRIVLLFFAAESASSSTAAAATTSLSSCAQLADVDQCVQTARRDRVTLNANEAELLSSAAASESSNGKERQDDQENDDDETTTEAIACHKNTVVAVKRFKKSNFSFIAVWRGNHQQQQQQSCGIFLTRVAQANLGRDVDTVLRLVLQASDSESKDDEVATATKLNKLPPTHVQVVFTVASSSLSNDGSPATGQAAMVRRRVLRLEDLNVDGSSMELIQVDRCVENENQQERQQIVASASVVANFSNGPGSLVVNGKEVVQLTGCLA